MRYHEVFFILLAFFSELIGTLSGVSSSTLFVPAGAFFETVQITLVLTACLHVLGNSTRILMYWREIHWGLTFKFGVPSVVMAGVGAQFSDLFPAEVFSIVLGIFLIGMSYLFYYEKKSNLFSGKWSLFLGGSLSGLFTGMLGSGGAIRSLSLSAFGLSPLAFTATSTIIDFGGDMLRLQVYLNKGYLNKEHYFYIPILMGVVVGANGIAKSVLQKIDKEKFKKIVIVFVFGSGVLSIFSGLLKASARL